MHFELVMTCILVALCWAILAVADAVVAGLSALIFGVRFKTVFLWGLLSFLLPVLAIVYGTFIERNIYSVRPVTVRSSSLPPAFQGFRIALISDIHLRSFAQRPASLSRAVEKINSLDADVVCFTGDLVSLDVSELDGFGDILRRLSPPVYSVLGNHDYLIYGRRRNGQGATRAGVDSLKASEKALGWNLLLNENRILTRGRDSLAIVGVENTSASKHFPSHGNLSRAMTGTDGCFRILLSHDPTHWDMEVIGRDIPLTLSGHTHALQFSLFGWCPSRYLFRHYRGLYQEAGQSLYVNTGLGETIFPARIGARPEITLITLSRN